MVLLRNSARDGRKGDKFKARWLGPYMIKESLGKKVYRLSNPTPGHTLKKAFNGCRHVFIALQLCTHADYMYTGMLLLYTYEYSVLIHFFCCSIGLSNS